MTNHVNAFLCNWIAAAMFMHAPLTMRLLLYLQSVLYCIVAIPQLMVSDAQ